MFRELDERDAIFDLPRRKFFLGDPDVDLSVSLHGRRASSALGPAAGPHTQMAQNIVLSWLCGCRIMELKTVQILDELEIPRPCIDMQTIGYNVEWSQELKLEQSLVEYVKASMLIDILGASDALAVDPGYRDCIFDMSVGYDLQGIKTERVQAFIDGMLDARPTIDKLRAELPAAYRDTSFRERISDTLTLSTFHGCPPDEIERIIEYLLEEKHLHCIVKLNPTLLGEKRVNELVREQMGYTDVHIPSSAFAKDTTWEQAAGFVERLGEKAKKLGLGFGVKFTNTLIVENHRKFFPETEKEMYLSGPPLHVLAMNLVRRFRRHFGDAYPISFSAGIDNKNFADAAAIGLVPITVCSDLLKPGGYVRASRYLTNLGKRMAALGAGTIGDYIIRAHGHGAAALDKLGLDSGGGGNDDRAILARCRAALAGGSDLRAAAGEHYPRWVSEAVLLGTETYVDRATADTRYHKAKNSKPPRKLGTHLELFDCVTCAKCVPVCPNNANFIFVLPRLEVPIVKVRLEGDRVITREDGRLVIEKKEQYANFADFCNECGDCDIFCPEDGGPYVVKPRFFGSHADWQLFAALDGFYFDRLGDNRDTTYGRIDGREFRLEVDSGRAGYSGPGFEVSVMRSDPIATLSGRAEGDVEIDLAYYHILIWLRDAVLRGDAVNYVNA